MKFFRYWLRVVSIILVVGILSCWALSGLVEFAIIDSILKFSLALLFMLLCLWAWDNDGD